MSFIDILLFLFKLLVITATLAVVLYSSHKFVKTHKPHSKEDTPSLMYNMVCSTMSIIIMFIAVFVAFYTDHIMRFLPLAIVESILTIIINISQIAVLQFLWSLFCDIVAAIAVGTVILYAHAITTMLFPMKGKWKVRTMLVNLIMSMLLIVKLTFVDNIDGYTTMDFIILNAAVILPLAFMTYYAYGTKNEMEEDF